MLKVAVAALVVTQAGFAAEIVREVDYNALLGNQLVPVYDKGYLMLIHRPPTSEITVYGPDGNRAYDVSVTTPQAATVSVGNMAMDADGTMAVTAGYREPHGYAAGIALVDPAGRQIGFIETGRYVPCEVAFGSDHSIWTFGWQRDEQLNDRAETQDYFVFRKFSRDGKQVGAYLLRSLFPRGLEPGACAVGGWKLRVANDRVGALVTSGNVGSEREWVELDLSGKLLGRWRMNDRRGLAFTESGVLYSRAPYDKGTPPQLEVFDRVSGTWKPIPGAFSISELIDGHWLLLGADGDYLVVCKTGAPGLALGWLQVAQR